MYSYLTLLHENLLFRMHAYTSIFSFIFHLLVYIAQMFALLFYLSSFILNYPTISNIDEEHRDPLVDDLYHLEQIEE